MLSLLIAVALVPFVLTTRIPTQNSEVNALKEKPDYASHAPGRTNGNWLGWGADIYNNRLAAPDASINASNVASLKQVCREEHLVGVSATPLVINGVVYYPTWNGLLVALSYRHCLVLWQINISAIVTAYKPIPADFASYLFPASRTTPVANHNVLFVGTLANALLLAIDQHSGRLLDQIQLNNHPVAIITMSPTFYDGKIFVGTASQEEYTAGVIAGYECCSFIGNMNGLTFHHNKFKLLWSLDMAPARSNFTGAAVWGSQPSIDPNRNQVFVATGNVYSVPDSYTACQNNQTTNATTTGSNSTTPSSQNTTDPCAPPDLYQESILAFDTASGKINWFRELSPLDAWNVACVTIFGSANPGACPPNPGPDADFGMAPSFVPGSANTPKGEDTLFIGQKNGNLYGISAATGELFWATATSPDGTIGGLIWGIAVDDEKAYYTAVNSLRTPWELQDGTRLTNGAFGAASLLTGKIVWETPVPRDTTSQVMPSVVNDVVLVGTGGTVQGSLMALDKNTGKVIKETMLGTYFQGGIAIAGKRVFFGTGYPIAKNVTGSLEVWRI